MELEEVVHSSLVGQAVSIVMASVFVQLWGTPSFGGLVVRGARPLVRELLVFIVRSDALCCLPFFNRGISVGPDRIPGFC